MENTLHKQKQKNVPYNKKKQRGGIIEQHNPYSTKILLKLS
jgi:hypothetical protein